MIASIATASPSRSLRLIGALLFFCILGMGCADEGTSEGESVLSPNDLTQGDDVGTPDTSIEKGGASSSCYEWRASGAGPLGGSNSIVANCRTVTNGWTWTEVWLPGCMGNNNGELVWGGRYFDRSCSNCRRGNVSAHGQVTFICSCRRVDGSWNHASINLNKHLTNRNGTLTCD